MRPGTDEPCSQPPLLLRHSSSEFWVIEEDVTGNIQDDLRDLGMECDYDFEALYYSNEESDMEVDSVPKTNDTHHRGRRKWWWVGMLLLTTVATIVTLVVVLPSSPLPDIPTFESKTLFCPGNPTTELMISFFKRNSQETQDFVQGLQALLAPVESCFPSTLPQWRALERLAQERTESSYPLEPAYRTEWIQLFVGILLVQTWNLEDTLMDLDFVPCSTSRTTVLQDESTGMIASGIADPTMDVDTNDTRPCLSGDLCDWFGISCTNDGIWKALEWSGIGFDLQGSIPTEIVLLTDLVLLDLSQNENLRGTIPSQLSKIQGLQALYLEETGLTGTLPTGLKLLKDLRLSKTKGISAKTLFQPAHSNTTDTLLQEFPALEWLAWSQGWDTTMNEEESLLIVHPWPPTINKDEPNLRLSTEIGLLTNLRGLELDGNGFTGNLPTEIGLLSNLQVLNLSYNHFDGTLPTEIANLNKLDMLSIRSSGMQGTLPASLPSLSRLSLLELGGTNRWEPQGLADILQQMPMDCACGPYSNTRRIVLRPLAPSRPDECVCSAGDTL